MSEFVKKYFWILFAVVAVAFAVAYALMGPGPEHIEDINGPDDDSLAVITPADIAAFEMGERGGIETSETQWDVAGFDFTTGIKYSSSKFTGLHLFYTCTIFKSSDVRVLLSDYRVKSGNFAFYVVLDGEIIGEAVPDEFGTVDILIENIEKTGTLEYIIAGESASFSFVAPSDWHD